MAAVPAAERPVVTMDPRIFITVERYEPSAAGIVTRRVPIGDLPTVHPDSMVIVERYNQAAAGFRQQRVSVADICMPPAYRPCFR